MSNALNEITERIVRYGDLSPCKTAFIDAHTPGSDQKENFTIIGGGVSESADQHIHINLPGPSTQVPLFLHGALRHSSTFISQFLP